MRSPTPVRSCRSARSGGRPSRVPPTAGSDRFDGDVPTSDFLYARSRTTTRPRSSEDEHGRLRQALSRSLRKERKTLERKLDKIGRSLAEAEQAVGLERSGELLKSVLSRVKKGDSEVTASDFDSGEPVVIPLDPKLSPAENLERMFKRYQKAVRGLTKAGAQHAEVKAAHDDVVRCSKTELVEAGPAAAKRSTHSPRVRPWRSCSRSTSRRRPPRRVRAHPGRCELGKRVVPGRLVPRRYRTEGGLEVWVGRNDAGNDYLTTRLAAGNDLFFHLDGAPGSHVILRTGGKKDPPSEAVLDASELAVHFSKAKNATRADVPRGADQEREEAEGRQARARDGPRRQDAAPAPHADATREDPRCADRRRGLTALLSRSRSGP